METAVYAYPRRDLTFANNVPIMRSFIALSKDAVILFERIFCHAGTAALCPLKVLLFGYNSEDSCN